ncbi:CBS domain-containing protein [Thalassolituus maritimus]|uniref:CBS domain-containing protein n=1 Tax=Thalassolituus maritimus TaxID=484498 RepID=A0A1N7ME52_9GAMM|nr:CBS domain-containing protein [Thalassolituus maritimus]SIS84281.1 CBS domain-containing protein [Thalassolituus maritimus]
MGLIVFDMGRRVETPVNSPRRRVSPVERPAAVSNIENEPDQTPSSDDLIYSPEGTTERQEHAPQTVAFAADIMTRNVITIRQETTIRDAYQLMREHDIHHLPVIDEHDNLQALVSDRRILRALAEQRSVEHDSVMTVAARPVYCTAESTDIRQTARLLTEYHIGALLVLNNKEQLTGIITRSDLLHLLSEYGPLELWA